MLVYKGGKLCIGRNGSGEGAEDCEEMVDIFDVRK